MAYTPYYENGWANNEEGGTPINAEALNHMETGISAATEAAEAAKDDAGNALTDAKEYSDANLAAAKKYSDANLTTAKEYSDANLKAAKSYTDGVAETLEGEIAQNASDITAVETRLGGMTFAINADDLGLDIIID